MAMAPVLLLLIVTAVKSRLGIHINTQTVLALPTEWYTAVYTFLLF